MPDPRTLPEDIYRLLSDDNDHVVSEENLEWAGEVFKSVLRTRLRKRTQLAGEDVLRFSSLGKKDRQLWFAANRPETAEAMPPKANFKFLYGDIIEILMLFLARESGHEVTHEQFKVEEDNVVGHTDACIDGVPVDCKSASSFSYQKFNDGSFVFDDPFGYLQQLSGYANKLGKTERAGFLVADKQHGDLCFAEIDSYVIKGNLPKERIAELREVLRSDQPPPRCYPDVADGSKTKGVFKPNGNRKLGIGCSYCKFKDACWADANGGAGLRKFFYSRGPVWFTHVEKEPRVSEASNDSEG